MGIAATSLLQILIQIVFGDIVFILTGSKIIGKHADEVAARVLVDEFLVFIVVFTVMVRTVTAFESHKCFLISFDPRHK